MSSSGGIGGRSFPTTLQLRAGASTFDIKLLNPSLLPLGDVTGFAMTDEDALSQEQVDRATSSLQAFIAGAPAEDQAVYATLLAQAQGYADDNWPAD